MENDWNGTLLGSVEAVVRTAEGMRWNGKHPLVRLVTDIYKNGVGLTKKAMQALEGRLKRLPSLPKWFVDIAFTPTPG